MNATDAGCPHCGAGVQPKPAPPKVDAWSCAECGLDFAVTVINPESELASLVSVLRTTVFLAVLRAEVFGAVARRAELDSPMDVTLPPQTPAGRRLSCPTALLLATGPVSTPTALTPPMTRPRCRDRRAGYLAPSPR